MNGCLLWEKARKCSDFGLAGKNTLSIPSRDIVWNFRGPAGLMRGLSQPLVAIGAYFGE
jgi:hypothetical protein